MDKQPHVSFYLEDSAGGTGAAQVGSHSARKQKAKRYSIFSDGTSRSKIAGSQSTTQKRRASHASMQQKSSEIAAAARSYVNRTAAGQNDGSSARSRASRPKFGPGDLDKFISKYENLGHQGSLAVSSKTPKFISIQDHDTMMTNTASGVNNTGFQFWSPPGKMGTRLGHLNKTTEEAMKNVANAATAMTTMSNFKAGSSDSSDAGVAVEVPDP